jgi:hypothetical protein
MVLNEKKELPNTGTLSIDHQTPETKKAAKPPV